MSESTARVLEFLGFNEEDYQVSKSGSGGEATFTLDWYSVSPQPTEQEIATAEASQAYIDWRAENGGDPVKTLRKKTSDSLSQDSGALLRW